MAHIQLVHAKNIVARGEGAAPRQELEFLARVDNLAPEKRVLVHWCGEDGRWHQTPAAYQSDCADNREIWRACACFPLTKQASIPGDIEFAAQLECGGASFWDNAGGENYRMDADSGITVFGGAILRNVDYRPLMHADELQHPVDVAVSTGIGPRAVTVHWSADGWATRHRVRCRRYRNHWDLTAGSNARNPNRYGWLIWRGQIPVQNVYRFEYVIECRSHSGVFWENNSSRNYLAHRGTLRTMTLNLHTWQEERQMEKFQRIARVIAEQKIDLVCFQEVGENWNHGEGDWSSNAARIINEALPAPYHLHTDWSHIGFDRYREGVAILSRHPFAYTDAGHISENRDVYDIHTRKIVMAQVKIPFFGLINVFCVHLSWPSQGFYDQFERLRAWVNARHSEEVAATLVAGDFNIKAGTDAYRHIAKTGEFEDQYLKAVNRHAFNQIFRDRPGDPARHLPHDHRIDYQFTRTGSRLRVVDARELFTEQDGGRVSDHTAYFTEYELI